MGFIPTPDAFRSNCSPQPALNFPVLYGSDICMEMGLESAFRGAHSQLFLLLHGLGGSSGMSCSRGRRDGGWRDGMSPAIPNPALSYLCLCSRHLLPSQNPLENPKPGADPFQCIPLSNFDLIPCFPLIISHIFCSQTTLVKCCFLSSFPTPFFPLFPPHSCIFNLLSWKLLHSQFYSEEIWPRPHRAEPF